MAECEKCGGELQERDFERCGTVQFCPDCEPTKYVRTQIYLNGKEMEYCVEVNTRTGEERIVSTREV